MLQLFGGLFLLVIGAELSVRAAVRLAASLKVRPLIIGLTVVAMSSSAPQMAVSLQAAFSSSPDISVGSVVGSNIFNVLVTLGLCALIIPLRVARQLVRVDIPLMIGASALVFALAYNGELSAIDGAILLFALLAYLLVLARRSQGQVPKNPPGQPHASRAQQFISLMTMVFGLALLVMGAGLLVQAAAVIAQDLGLSERVIGLTVIAGSTSLPALTTSLIAAMRGERDIAVGNVIGSNLFNLLGVLGLTAMVAPSPLSISPNALNFDLPVMLAVSAVCLPVFYSGYRVTRTEGLLLLSLYLAYGLHIVSFTTGMPLANTLEKLMSYGVLPLLAALILFTTVRAWRRQH
ncbi:calcium/sodium antiporter [Pseudomonas sp. MH10]|uniref:calcium/sodium antiporter n=1 Tax=Pseudomonas sp. MH10 TaxID=3048627 RepID=UPI002AC9641D|nr:calcium/sodium antiporter [Pseudomonas sp. MH10]MEB0038884.1 calcium/sodium antiporter [Pseudomonas sp. MH10]WPX66585.1 calcium/sodium antiporter [Pseudomonas sp. MH10]